MPTVIVLDVSLSMMLPTSSVTESTEESLLLCARAGIAMLCDAILESSKYEFISLITFSEDAEILVPFSRCANDIFSILQSKMEAKSRSRLAPALRLAQSNCLSTWGRNTFCQIIVVTDGDCLEQLDFEISGGLQASDFSLPTVFPSLCHFVLLSPKNAKKLAFYSQLCQANTSHNQHFRALTMSPCYRQEYQTIYWINPVSCEALEGTFRQIVEKSLSPLNVVLRCGNLCSSVCLHPPSVSDYCQLTDFESVDRSIGNEISIIGFIKPGELAHAAVVLRYLVLGVSEDDSTEPQPKSRLGPSTPEKTPSFYALLHAALKSEDLVAICELGAAWYGMICVVADIAKRSNLILNCFLPGSDIPWLGNLSELKLRPFDGCTDLKGAFPVEAKEKCSYFTSAQQPNLQHACWVQTVGLQTDLQKLLRYVRKLPEKEVQYYQELNRLCTYASAIGFTELLTNTVVTLLEKEKGIAQSNQHIAVHVAHTVKCIRSLLTNSQYGEILPP